MQANELMELAAIVAAHGPVLVEGPTRLTAHSLEDYWTTAKIRLDRWTRALAAWSQPHRSGSSNTLLPEKHPPAGLFEEVLTGEVLARVWTAVMCAYDRRRGQCEVEPLARSVLVGQLEARNRVLTLLLRGTFDPLESQRLDQLRRRCERWTDLLLGGFGDKSQWNELAFEPHRAAEFAAEFAPPAAPLRLRPAWQLWLASLRATFRTSPTAPSPNAEINARIAATVIACFPPEVFDSTGLIRSLWFHRMQQTADDALGLLDQLLGPADPPDASILLRNRSSSRFGRPS